MSIPGNQNARKGREWRDALRHALAMYEDPDREVERGQALDRVAKTVIDAAIDGKESAYKEIGNRLDGKPVQATEIDVKLDIRTVLLTLSAKVGTEQAREVLTKLGAKHLLPIFDQINDKPQVIEHKAAIAES